MRDTLRSDEYVYVSDISKENNRTKIAKEIYTPCC